MTKTSYTEISEEEKMKELEKVGLPTGIRLLIKAAIRRQMQQQQTPVCEKKKIAKEKLF